MIQVSRSRFSLPLTRFKLFVCCSSKLDCKEQNGYGATIKPDIGAGAGPGAGSAGWGGAAPVRPAVCTPDMTRYTPSTADQVPDLDMALEL